MIIWSGLGFLVPVIGFLGLLASAMLMDVLFDDDQYAKSHVWPQLVGWLAAGAMLWFLGRYLNRGRARRMIDAQTGELVVLRNNHSFFFIPMEYWALVCVIFGVSRLIN